MIAVQMAQNHIIQIGRQNAHGSQLLVHRLSRRKLRLVHAGQERAEIMLLIVAHLPAPAGVKQNAPLRMLNQVSADRQPDAVALSAQKARIGQPPSGRRHVRQRRIHADLSAVQNMYFDLFHVLLPPVPGRYTVHSSKTPVITN